MNSSAFSLVKVFSSPDPGILPGLEIIIHGGSSCIVKLTKMTILYFFPQQFQISVQSLLTNPVRFRVNPCLLGIFACRYLRDLNGHH